ncbi:MAG: L-rhamnose/proton symporter RhaT [Planctomycetota bacterium]|jgi:L-rhamnose-H+ transport protein
MQPEQLLGFGLMLAGAICGGSFGLPSKYVKEDTPWEVLWGPFFLFVTIAIPVVVAPLVVDDLGGVYTRVGWGKIIPVLVFGFLWGLGSMTLGMSFAFIGLSLAYALNYGAQIVFGSMMPLALFDPDQILTPHGYLILAGVGVCVVGVAVCGRAGILKDRSLEGDAPAAETESSAAKKPRMLIGLVVGVASGVLCACYAVASSYAGPIGVEAGKNNPNWAAAWAITAMILWGGALSSCLYCAVQLTRNRTWGRLFGPGAGLVLMLAAAMAVLHDAAIFFFGLGWINLGDLGVSVGYPVFMSFAIIVGNVHGFRTGEWKGASRRSIAWIVAGIALLTVGVCVLAAGKSMMPS